MWRVASQIRLKRGAPEDEVVRGTLQDEDGTVRFGGEVRQLGDRVTCYGIEMPVEPA